MSDDLRAWPDEAGMRLDAFLAARLPGLSRRSAQRMVEAGRVRVEGQAARKGQRLEAGARITVSGSPYDARFSPQADPSVRLRVVYEDASIVVVDKASGTPSHPLRPDERGTLAQGLLARYPEMREVGHHPREPGLLHRLDRDTSGLLLAARDDATFEKLWQALRAGHITKHYLALVRARPQEAAELHGWLQIDRRKVRVLAQPASGAREARTRIVRVQPVGGTGWSVVEVRADHATRHQVRAQLAAAGHPLVGDVLYGGPALDGNDGHFLHACQIELEHPWRGAHVSLRAPLPQKRRQLLYELDAAFRDDVYV